LKIFVINLVTCLSLSANGQSNLFCANPNTTPSLPEVVDYLAKEPIPGRKCQDIFKDVCVGRESEEETIQDENASLYQKAIKNFNNRNPINLDFKKYKTKFRGKSLSPDLSKLLSNIKKLPSRKEQVAELKKILIQDEYNIGLSGNGLRKLNELIYRPDIQKQVKEMLLEKHGEGHDQELFLYRYEQGFGVESDTLNILEDLGAFLPEEDYINIQDNLLTIFYMETWDKKRSEKMFADEEFRKELNSQIYPAENISQINQLFKNEDSSLNLHSKASELMGNIGGADLVQQFKELNIELTVPTQFAVIPIDDVLDVNASYNLLDHSIMIQGGVRGAPESYLFTLAHELGHGQFIKGGAR
jgi:hypothetical protein